MPLITVKQGGPANDLEDGVYPVILTALDGPKTIYPANAPDGTDIFDWTFAIDDEAGDREIRDSTSTASGPKSKMYGWLTALLGGKPPAVGQNFDAPDLVGRQALATIGHNENGWPKITQLTAIPAAMLQRQFAQVTGTPTAAPQGQPARTGLNMQPARRPTPRGGVNGAPAAVPTATAPGADDLPF